MSDFRHQQVREKLQNYLIADDRLRKNPISWAACHPGPETEEGREYYRLAEEFCQAKMELWDVTDCEYGDEPLYKAMWEWRYWKVRARKCCWYQKRFGSTFRAGRTMAQLDRAEVNLVKVCGLSSIYRDACSYIEERFPKLRFKRNHE